MNINTLFKEFAFENLSTLPHPTAKNRVVTFSDLSSLCDLLFHFINFEVEEFSLKRIRNNFETDFEKIYNLDKKELASAIEGLATNFESFLKKIALIKYNDNSIWIGGSNYKGIKKCTLFELIDSKASKIDINIPGPEFKEFPSPLVNNSGASKAILDFVRSELRNSVHSANPYTRTQLIQYSNLVLGAYLIAISDNIDFLKKRFFPEFGYLESILNQKEYSKLNKYYIDIYGKEEIFNFENIAIEQLDGQKLIESINFLDDEDTDEKNAPENLIEDVARIDSVSNISRDTKRFIITGEPGSGKTTCLQKILLENAGGVLNGEKGSRLPIYIKASSYSLSKSFEYLVKDEVKFMPFEDILSKHRILLLIDGLNEIEDEFKRVAINELNEFLFKYEQVDVILSSRKFGFVNYFNLDNFELKKLNDNQIRQLLSNVLGKEKGFKLWQQIEKNVQILNLASNPLMLMMIIRVSSLKNHEIPPNKGMLYKLFNDAILAREQKFYSTDINTKKDILSLIAFWMRSNGIFKTIKIVQAKDLVNKRLSKLDHSVGVNEVLHELSDNNFFIQKNDELEFYHETQQEYFVAIELQNLFFNKEDLDFDYSDNKWFEPILICSDLFTNDEDRMNFFVHIFIGKKSNIPKRLNELDKSDVNTKFFVACKVAYNLRDVHPALFKKAKIFLENYITVWHYRFSQGVLITDYENILRAVASLSSEEVFRKFFYDLRNLEWWFFNKEVDERTNDEELLKKYDEKFNLYIKVFFENLNDFTLLYKVLNDKKKEFNLINGLSRSVYYNVKFFSRFLLANSPTSQLIHAFKETKSKELLFEIGKSDLDFFIENYYSIQGSKESEFFDFISDNHIRNILGVEFLINSLKNKKIETDVRLSIIRKLISRSEYTNSVFEALQNVKQQDDVLTYLEEVKDLLNMYPIDILRKFDLDSIYTNPSVEKIQVFVKVIKENPDYFVLEAHNNDIDCKEIKKGIYNFFYGDNSIDLSTFNNSQYSDRLSNIVVVYGVDIIVKQCFDKYAKGGSFTLHYLDERRHSITKSFLFKELYLFSISNQLMIEIDSITAFNIKGITKRYKNIKLVMGQEFRFTVKEVSKYYTSIFLKCPKGSFDFSSVDPTLHLYKVNLDFSKPYNYHKDIIKSNQAFIRYIRNQINRPEVISFVKVIGLVHLFIKELTPNNYNLGIIIDIFSSDYYRVWDISKGKLVNRRFVKSDLNTVLNINDVVVIEQNSILAPVSSEYINEKYFVRSEVVSVRPEYSEGFIAGNSKDKDYYFISKHCNFSPYVGLVVKFIPGINYSKNNSLRPMAYCISAIGNKNKTARVEKIVEGHDYKFKQVFFIDLITGEELYSLIYQSQKIFNYFGDVKIGDIFSYYTHKRYIGTNRIYLIAKEDFTSNDS